MKHCQWCDQGFSASVSYQIYCSIGCRESATKEKIAERYLVLRRSRRLGKIRSCKSCGSPLSIYNDDPLCISCTVNPLDVTKALKEIKKLGNAKNSES